MESLELFRKKTELSRVAHARMELELRMRERLDEVDRIKEHIAVQEAKEKELASEIAEMSKK